MQEQLPNGTIFHVFHSKANLRMLQAEFGAQIDGGRMRLTDLQTLNVTQLSRYTSNWCCVVPSASVLISGSCCACAVCPQTCGVPCAVLVSHMRVL